MSILDFLIGGAIFEPPPRGWFFLLDNWERTDYYLLSKIDKQGKSLKINLLPWWQALPALVPRTYPLTDIKYKYTTDIVLDQGVY